MRDLQGKVWSRVLDGVRYTGSGDTLEIVIAREERKAAEITDAILALVAEALTSEAVYIAADAVLAEIPPREYMTPERWAEVVTAALRAAGIVPDGA